MNTFAKSLVVAAGLISTGAWAEEGPWYIAGTIGRETYRGFGGVNQLPDSVSEQSYGVAVGYRFNRNVALELGALNFGEAKGFNNYSPMNLHPCSGISGPLCNGSGSRTISANAAQVSLVVSAPITDWVAIYGRVGAARTKLKQTTVLDSITTDESANKSDGLGGIGLAFNAAPNVQVTLEWQRLTSSKIDNAALGVRILF